MGQLIFNEESHTYQHEGEDVFIPSVTRILGQYVKVKIGELGYLVDVYNRSILADDRMDNIADIGKAIHKGTEYLDLGIGLNWDRLAEELKTPLERFQEWKETFGAVPVEVEKLVHSHKWWYAGTLDRIYNIAGVHWVIDIKTGVGAPSFTTGAQTIAYEKAWREDSGWTGKVKRGCLHLPRDGKKPKLIPYEDNKNDWEFFKCRLFQFGYVKGKLGKRG